jgi:L-threonylcarbamoyladenylate synthase
MPSSKIALKLIKECGVPIAAPSSNISGSPSPTSFLHVIHDLNGKIPCILIGPITKYGLESTVVDCTGKHPVILRPGVITLEQLKEVNKNVRYRTRTGKILSPGQKYRHYAPKAKVRLIRSYELGITDLKINIAYIGLNKKSAKKFAIVKVCRSND